MYCFNQMKMTVQSLQYFTCVILVIIGAYGNQAVDLCDWKKSGLIHSVSSREIEKVKLSCTSGNLEWVYPTTALQIEFQHPQTTTDFTACFLASADFSGATLLHQGKRPLDQRANTFEQPTGLSVVYADPDVKDKMHEHSQHDISEIACVNSTGGKLSMLLMATFPRTDISRKVAAFKYELFPINYHKDRPAHKSHFKKLYKQKKMMFDGSIEDCRPCTREELSQLFCSADFVARGHVLSAADDENHKWTNVEFISDHVIREVPSDWSLFKSLAEVPQFNLSRIPSSIAGRAPLTQTRIRQLRRGFFHVPAQCGFRAPEKLDVPGVLSKNGENGFVLMGNYNFDSGWLECFPRWDDMTELIKREIKDNSSPRRHSSVDGCDYQSFFRTMGDDNL